MDPRWQVFSLGKSECLTHSNQMQLSPKPTIFFQFFSLFMKSTLNFEDFEKRDEPHSWPFSQVKDSQMSGYLNAEKDPRQNTYGESTW